MSQSSDPPLSRNPGQLADASLTSCDHSRGESKMGQPGHGPQPNTGEPARMLPSFPEGLTTCWLPRAPPAARMAQACQNKTSETGPQGGLWLTRPYELGPLSSSCHSCATNSSLASALFSPEKHVGDNTQLGVVSLGPREPTAQRKCHQQSPCGPQER